MSPAAVVSLARSPVTAPRIVLPAAPGREEGVKKASVAMADDEQTKRKEEVSELTPFDPTKKKKKRRLMHRQPEHVIMFLLAEMGTSGSLDGQQRLVIKGRFVPENFEAILRRYIMKLSLTVSKTEVASYLQKRIQYLLKKRERLDQMNATCNGCKSPDTIHSKENRLFFLRCEQCGSSRSVAPIKSGFVAQVGRRKAGT
ncbi:hypothetical protein ABZP36_030660 [Zizania latifolia]